jgi:hypothetical protein
MLPLRLSLFSLVLLLALARPASAQDDTASRAGALPQGLDQAVYKGLVGNVLDVIPMNSSDRLDLQRTNAVVSNTLLGRTLAVLAGLSNPVLLVGGFAWGMWAASNIRPATAGMNAGTGAGQSGGNAAAAHERMVALLGRASAMDDPPAKSSPEPILVSSISPGGADAAALAPAQVIKIWLPQRSLTLSQ